GNHDHCNRQFLRALTLAEAERPSVRRDAKLRAAAVDVADVAAFTRGLTHHSGKVGVDVHVMTVRVDMELRAGGQTDVDPPVVRLEAARPREAAVRDANVAVV